MHPIMQVDTFTTEALHGNPCAVVFGADDLSAAMMQAIAREMNLSETAFVLQSQIADFGARYFTPAEEIPMAGHPTIATIHALIEIGQIKLAANKITVTLELPVGALSIDIDANERVPRIIMTQKPPQFMRTYDPAAVAPVFGLTPDDLVADVPIQTVSTGTPQLMLAVRDVDRLRSVQVNHEAYVKLREQGDFFSPHLFCTTGVTPAGHTFARHFGTPPDTLEDPFTGSATGGMAAYLWHYGLIEAPRFVAEQGHWMQRPGQASVEVIGPPESMTAVKVGGTAVTVLRGELLL